MILLLHLTETPATLAAAATAAGRAEVHNSVPSNKTPHFLVAQFPPPFKDTAAITAHIKLNPQVRACLLYAAYKESVVLLAA